MSRFRIFDGYKPGYTRTPVSDVGKTQQSGTVTNGTQALTQAQAAIMGMPPVSAPAAPVITLQPVASTVNAPAATTFTVAATGEGALSYQWRKNGVPIAGATSASYTTPATSVIDSGAQFTCDVSTYGVVTTSDAVTLTVMSGIDRYYRIYAVGAPREATHDIYFLLRELALRDTVGGVNRALSKPVSSNAALVEYPLVNLVDGSTANYTQLTSVDRRYMYMQVDLGADPAWDIREAVITQVGGANANDRKDYDIYSSPDGVTWRLRLQIRDSSYDVNVRTVLLTAVGSSPVATPPSGTQPQWTKITSSAISTSVKVGIAYSKQFTGTGDGALTWAVVSGTLPPGLSLNSTTGLLSGTPTASAVYNFVVQATAANSGSSTTQEQQLTTAQPVITSGSPPAGGVGTPYSFTFTADCVVTWALQSGALPNGLTLSSAGVLSGTPTNANTFNFTVAANTAGGGQATQAVSITVTGGVTARYWRFEAVGYLIVYEIEMFPAAGTQNFAAASAGSTATASDIIAAGYEASKAIDGVNNSDTLAWKSQNTQVGHWIEIDLGQARAIKTIKVYPRNYDDGIAGWESAGRSLTIKAGNSPAPSTVVKTLVAGTDYPAGTTSVVTTDL